MGTEPARRDEAKRVVSVGELVVEFFPCGREATLREARLFRKHASGAAATFACALSRLGGRAGMVAKVGDDPLSSFAVNELVRHGVETACVRVAPGMQIGLVFIENLQDGRRFQYYRRGFAGSCLGSEDVDPGYVASSAAVHFSGMLLEISASMRAACFRAAELARSGGLLLSFDPNLRVAFGGPGELGEGHARDVRRSIEMADVVSPSLEEARLLTGKVDPNEAARELLAWGPRVVAVTMGDAGCLVATSEGAVPSCGIPVKAVDPTGAGDVFAAALLLGVLEGWDAGRTASFANAAGALMTTATGTIGRAIPSRRQVDRLVSRLRAGPDPRVVPGQGGRAADRLTDRW